MTYRDDVVIPDLKVRMEDANGNYQRLHTNEIQRFRAQEPPSPRKGRPTLWWFKMFLVLVLVISVVVVFIIWVGPFLLDKEVVPILDWEIKTFSPQALGVILFASLVIFPSLILPSTPSMWVAGITFGYGFGFLLILPAMTIGMSLPYCIGSLFRHKLYTWLERWPEKAAIIRLAGEGDWFHQFRAVFLLRISPFPFVIFNYASVAANIRYGPYICGSIVGVIPEIFVTIYSGILIRSLADATQDHRSLTTPQIIYNVLGFSATVAATIAITIYAKRTLKKLQTEEELLLA